MELLAQEIKRECFIQHLVKRTDKVAMYDVTLDDEIIGYEVFIIKEQEEGTRQGPNGPIHLKAKEKFPVNEDFGYTAYAPSTREKADEYFERLENRLKMREAGIKFSEN